MTCTRNASGLHCWEEDPEAHRGGRECCLCGELKPPMVLADMELKQARRDIAEAKKALADAQTGVIQTPTIRCRCCGLKAPRKVVQMHPNPGNLLGLKAAEQNDLNGWMLLVFPYKDTYIAERYQGAATARFGVPFSEVAKVCPKCATTIMGTVVHLSDGPLSEEDL